MFIKIMKMRLDELAVYMAGVLGGFAAGSALLALITYFEKDDPDFTVFRMGSVFAVIVAGFISVFVGMYGVRQLFHYQISFSLTRKRFFVYDLIVSFLWYAAALLLAGVLYYAEGGILKIGYQGFTEDKFPVFLEKNLFLCILVLALACTVIRELMGGLLMRFGNTVLIIMWLFWMAGSILPVRLADIKKNQENEAVTRVINGISQWIAGISPAGWTAIGAVLMVGAVVISWMLVRKQAVTA